ncbi:inorganic pyrophosphatase TTM1-like [Henckelia pumila]|uniref:inorganic pyrophosphatase TTM1-like n=1 Tax=Henckelia pumila TaxID=405737 RepID=UPI003C6DE6AA
MAPEALPGAESPRRRSGLLRDQVQLVKSKDSDRFEIVPIHDPLSFEKGFFVTLRACQLLAQKNEGMVLVGIAGPSGAGKTVMTEKIHNFVPSIAIINMDNYNDAGIVDGNFDDPRLTDYDTLLENIRDLKAGKPVQIPIYDFVSGSRIGYRTLEVPSSRIVIIEGRYALSEKLRPLLDLRVSVNGGVHFDLVKRLLRDIQRAGQEPEEIIHQISETVYPMYKAFIEPDLRTAHIKIINKFNPFSGFQNPTYILKSTRTITVEQIKAVFSGDYIETTEETYDIYLLPPGEDPEACQSYLRMRNRDGKYYLMFEEWVTDSPFIISPRFTFEVGVCLLGMLMALGYTIGSILKRSSLVFSDDKISVKADWLEQLNRNYVQVQGRDRLYVKYVAEELGLDGSFIPRTYIEQIQLEKLINDIMALPNDLKTKLSIDDDLVSSPKEALSRASADRRAKFLHGGIPRSYSDANLTKLASSRRYDGRTPDSPAALANQAEACNASVPASQFVSGIGNGSLSGSLLPNSLSSSQLAKESPFMEEILLIARGQRQIMHQIGSLSNLLHEYFGERSHPGRTSQPGGVPDMEYPLAFLYLFLWQSAAWDSCC